MSGKTEVDEEHMFGSRDAPEEGGRARSQLVIRTEDEAQLKQQMAPRPVECWPGKPRRARPHYHLLTGSQAPRIQPSYSISLSASPVP